MNIAIKASDQLMAKSIFNISVKSLGWNEALAFASSAAFAEDDQTIISFINAHNTNLAMRDRTYHDLLQKHVVFPDGVGVDIAARVMSGNVFPANLKYPTLRLSQTPPRYCRRTKRSRPKPEHFCHP